MKLQQRPGKWIRSVLVLSFGWFLLYAARTVLSVTLKDIADYWSLSETFLGLLSSGFFMAYTALQIPTGFLADRFGSKRVLLTGFGLQSLAVLLSGFAVNQQQFLITRVMGGAGQATYFACQFAIISNIVPPERKAFGNSASVAGSALGTGLGMIFGRLLSGTFLGWRLPFGVLGIISVLFVAAIIREVPEPRKPEVTGAVCPGPARHGIGGSNPASTSWVFLTCFSITHFLSMYGFYLMLTWLPYYLETIRGFDQSLAAIIPVVMPFAMAPSTILGGYVSDRTGSKSLVVNICLPVSAIATMAIPMMNSVAGLVLLLAVYGATGKLVIDPGLISYVTESAPVESRGTILAIFNFAGALAMAVAPAVTGYVAEVTGSFDPSFFMAGAFNILALGFFIAGARLFSKSGIKGKSGFGTSGKSVSRARSM